MTSALAVCLPLQWAAHQRLHRTLWLWSLNVPAPAGGGGRSFGGGGGFPGTGANAFPPAGGGYGPPAYGAPAAAPPTHASYTVPGAGEHGVPSYCGRQATPAQLLLHPCNKHSTPVPWQHLLQALMGRQSHASAPIFPRAHCRAQSPGMTFEVVHTTCRCAWHSPQRDSLGIVSLSLQCGRLRRQAQLQGEG